MKKLYFIAVVPNAAVSAEIQQIKLEFSEKYGVKKGLQTPPHITLQKPFYASPERINGVKNALEKLAETTESFTIKLNGFGCFAPRVIFVQPEASAGLNTLQNDLQRQLKSLDFTASELSEFSHPHITIAYRDLWETTFYKAWPEYEKKMYTATTLITHLCLFEFVEGRWLECKQFEMGL